MPESLQSIPAWDEVSEAPRQGSQFPYLFSDADVAGVHRSIAQHQRAVEDLECEMEDQMRVIRQLQHKKQQHLAEIKRYKGMISLAKRLPPEILASVFEECVRDGWTRTPLVVSSVCSSWRKAALTPTVWAYVYVNLNTQEPLRRTQLWLERSKTAPLSVHVEIGEDTTRLDRLLEMLIEEAGRWKDLSLKCVVLQPIQQLLQACTAPMPQLRSVGIAVGQELNSNHFPVATDNHWQLTAFRNAMFNASHLRNVRLERSILPTPGSLPPNITNLTLALLSHRTQTRHSAASLLSTLEELECLETLSLQVEVRDMDLPIFDLEPAQGRETDLPQLRSLTIMGATNIFGLLPHMRVPVLSELLLRSSLEATQDEATSSWLIRFFETSCHSISTLEIRDLALHATHYDEILPLVPSLRVLRLHDCEIVDTTLLQLGGSQAQCPSLSYLDLRWCGRLSGKTLVDIVRDRMRSKIGVPVHPLLEVTAINCSFVKEEDILNLAELTTCRLIHRGSQDFCYLYGCCENQKYRKRFRQRSPLHKDRQRKLTLIVE